MKEAAFCNQCGAPLSGKEKFCSRCGAKIVTSIEGNIKRELKSPVHKS